MQVNWQNIAYQSAVNAGHPRPDIFVAQMMAENGLKPNGPSSPAGAQGIAQIMPATAKGWGVDPHDPIASLNAAAKAMAKYIASYGGDHAKALAAYNAGPGAVAQYNGVPPYSETKKYIQRIMGTAGQYSGMKAGATSPSMAASMPTSMPTRKLVPGTDPGSLAKLQFAFTDDPSTGNAHVENRMQMQAQADNKYASAMQQRQSTPYGIGSVMGNVTSPGAKGYFRTPNGLIQNRRPGEAGYQFLDRVFGLGFGLKHDPGNTQTTGGSHASDGYHPKAQASDFGNARNPFERIDAAVKWAKPRINSLGLAELIWQDGGAHDNHAHFATRN